MSDKLFSWRAIVLRMCSMISLSHTQPHTHMQACRAFLCAYRDCRAGSVGAIPWRGQRSQGPASAIRSEEEQTKREIAHLTNCNHLSHYNHINHTHIGYIVRLKGETSQNSSLNITPAGVLHIVKSFAVLAAQVCLLGGVNLISERSDTQGTHRKTGKTTGAWGERSTPTHTRARGWAGLGWACTSWQGQLVRTNTNTNANTQTHTHIHHDLRT